MIRKFNRFELKYILRYSDYLRIIPHIEKQMARDPHAVSGDGKYGINSLYFDSPGLDFYLNKKDGIKFRRKVRIRHYLDSPSEKVFVEIKERINRIVRKRRCIVTHDEACELCHGRKFNPESLEVVDREPAAEVFYLAKALRLRPVIVIHYHREAFVGSRYEPGLRLTFDTGLKYRAHNLNPLVMGGEHFFFPPDIFIMEIKTNEKIPYWLTSVVSALECSLNRVSKYVIALDRYFDQLGNKRIVV